MEVEVFGQLGLHHRGASEIGHICIGAQARHGEDNEGDHDAGHRRPEHEANVRKQVGARYGRRQVGGIR